jgi:hypothetical protein
LKRLQNIFIVICLLLLNFSGVSSASYYKPNKETVKNSIEKSAAYLTNTVNGEYDGILDWPIIALWGVGEDVNTLITRKSEKIQSGSIVDNKLTTDFNRGMLTAAIVNKCRTFGGINLTAKVKSTQLKNGKFADFISGEGEDLVNSHIWSIISLYAAGEDIPNKQKVLEWLVEHQNDDGGFAFNINVTESDVDVTGMALIAFKALGKDRNYAPVKEALQFLLDRQLKDGSFETFWGNTSSETVSCVIQGLIMQDIDPTSSEWTQNGNPITALLKYQNNDGSFAHVENGKSNTMATYNALIALSDYYNSKSTYERLHNKNFKFVDVKENHWAEEEIRILAAKGIINGYPGGLFKPKNPVKREEFAKMIVLTTGEKTAVENKTTKFDDLPLNHWANSYVKNAVDKGLITGKANNIFAPKDKITGAEVMTILVRAKNLQYKVENVKGQPWYSGYVEIAGEYDLIYPEFNSEKYATRAQCAYSLAKILN